MIIKQFLLLRIASYGNQTILSTRSVAAEYRSRRRTAPETISRSRDMVGAQCPPKFKWFTWPNYALFRDGLLSVGWDLLWSTCTPNLNLA